MNTTNDPTATDRRALQAAGKHPAPCARFCEATAFYIVLRRLENENAHLRDFANAVIGGWPDDICLDGFELQEHAVKHGLLALKDPKPTAPCGEFCNCIEYHGSDPADWAAGVDCYVKTALLRHNVGAERMP